MGGRAGALTLAECGAGLLVLGGQQDAHDDVAPPWLPATRDLLSEASTAGLPTLGSCLGAQLLAVATGGRVQVSAPPGRESGVVEIRPRPAAADDALFGALAVGVEADHPGSGGVLALMPSMHADAVVELPSAAVWLASSELHPDVDTDDVVAQFREHDAEIARGGRAIAHSFAALVRAGVLIPV